MYTIQNTSDSVNNNTSCNVIFKNIKHNYIMKKIGILVLLIIGLLTMSSCRTTHVNKNGIPPGQAKKITGSQSASPYAPGQNK